MSAPLTDSEIAAIYWRDKDRKVFAVDVTRWKGKRRLLQRTYYCGARTPERAIAYVRKQQAYGVPKRASFVARLAGPRELGCVPTNEEARVLMYGSNPA